MLGRRLIKSNDEGDPSPIGASYIDFFQPPSNYLKGIGADGTDVVFLDDTNNRVCFSDINSWKTIYEVKPILAGTSDYKGVTFQNGTSFFWSAPSGGGNTRIYKWDRNGGEFNVSQIIPPFNTNDLSYSDEGILASYGNRVAVYDSSNALVRTFAISQHSGNVSVVWDGQNIWCGGNSDNFIYKYNKLGNYLGASIDMGVQFNYLAYDGVYWYTMDNSGVSKYTALF
jgi:hypothetical protein